MEDDELTEQIQEQVDAWSTNSTDCFTLNLIQGSGSKPIASFQPDFTYPIFGEEEAIFGYQGLSITLDFAAHDLRPNLSIKWANAFKPQGDIRPTDIEEALREFLPEDVFDQEQNKKNAKDDAAVAAGFKPPGEKIHSYKRGAETYEIWVASLLDEQAREILENMQILVPMFIEGGSTLQLEQDWSTGRWKLFLLYRVQPSASADTSPYCLVGYGTSYRVFTLPDRGDQQLSISDLEGLSDIEPLEGFLSSHQADQPPTSRTPLDLPSRERLSQFLILPPFQSAGHGQELYNTMYTHLSCPQNVREFTVEDPNEAFDDLRDLCDLLYLRKHVPAFSSLRVKADGYPADKLAPSAHIPTDLIVDGIARREIQRKTKIQERQFGRLVEMHTLSFIPPSHRSRARITRREKSSSPEDRAYYFWRLYAKQRLYVHNRDTLVQLEREERVERLEATVDSVQEGYLKCLEKVEARERDGEREVVGGASKPEKRKRKVVSEEEEEDEDDEVETPSEGRRGVNGHSAGKKARVE